MRNKENEQGKVIFVPEQESNHTSFITELKKLTGIENDDLLIEMISSASQGMPIKSDLAHLLNVSAQVLAESKPQDLNESRLCLQANALFSQGMHYLNKANNEAMISESEYYMRSAIKLLRLHNETVEAFHHYRRKGIQAVTVQQVNVNDGGQAIVGHIDTSPDQI